MVLASTENRRLTCVRCSYEWIPRKDQLPKRCPRCRLVKWNDAHLKVTCLRCDHTWNSHDGSPKRCPKCGSHQWNVPPNLFTCKRCGNVWESRSSKVPRKCAGCGSRLWDVVPEPYEEVRAEARPHEAREAEVLEAYRKGRGCIDIAISLGVPYSVVRDTVKRSNPGIVPKA